MVFVQHAASLTALGDTRESVDALLAGKIALQLKTIEGLDHAEPVPVAMIGAEPLGGEPRWMESLRRLAGGLPDRPWGTERFPIYITSSNYGIDHLYALSCDREARHHLDWATPHALIPRLRSAFGWGPQVTALSHACVTGQLGLLLAERAIERGQAESALVFSFDFLSPFVIGGFNALKILNGGMPAPYREQAMGSIGLGEGAGAVVLSAAASDFRIERQAVFNEMHHFTSNAPDGSGFDQVLASCVPEDASPKLWVKGHGTGTLEAGALEARAVETRLGDAPLVSWKGSIGHTLGSCAVVELALALEAIRAGRAPGTLGSQGPFMTDAVQADSFGLSPYDGVLLLSNAFGGAHGAMWISHE